jgi:hypothetical protein
MLLPDASTDRGAGARVVVTVIVDILQAEGFSPHDMFNVAAQFGDDFQSSDDTLDDGNSAGAAAVHRGAAGSMLRYIHDPSV